MASIQVADPRAGVDQRQALSRWALRSASAVCPRASCVGVGADCAGDGVSHRKGRRRRRGAAVVDAPTTRGRGAGLAGRAGDGEVATQVVFRRDPRGHARPLAFGAEDRRRADPPRAPARRERSGGRPRLGPRALRSDGTLVLGGGVRGRPERRRVLPPRHAADATTVAPRAFDRRVRQRRGHAPSA